MWLVSDDKQTNQQKNHRRFLMKDKLVVQIVGLVIQNLCYEYRCRVHIQIKIVLFLFLFCYK